MTDEYTQPDCPTPADATYQRDEAKRSSCSHSKGWPNELEAALLALAALFFGMWGYTQLLMPFGSQTLLMRRLHDVIPIALLMVLFLLMQRRFRFDLLGRFASWTVVFVAAAAWAVLVINLTIFNDKPISGAMIWAILWGGTAAPVVEELFFRGVLLEALAWHVTDAWAVIISTLAFVFIHAPATELYLGGLSMLVPLGLICGALTVGTRSVVPAILVHIAWNLYFILCFPYMGTDGFATATALGVAIILGISVTIGLLTYLNRRTAE